MDFYCRRWRRVKSQAHQSLMADKHLKSEFFKMNLQHCIPILVDNGSPIMIYLVEKYDKDDLLSPKDPKERVVVNVVDYFYLQISANADNNKMLDALEFLNTLLREIKYVADYSLTLVDLTVLATIYTYDVAKVDLGRYPTVDKWYAQVRKEGTEAVINEAGIYE